MSTMLLFTCEISYIHIPPYPTIHYIQVMIFASLYQPELVTKIICFNIFASSSKTEEFPMSINTGIWVGY